jgi:hypothetical protein
MGYPEIVQAVRLESFPSADDAVLSTAHSRKYIRDIFSGAAINGFGNRNREIANSLRYTVGPSWPLARMCSGRPDQPIPGLPCRPRQGFTTQDTTSAGDFVRSMV